MSKRYSYLKKIAGHKNFYRDEVSGKIHYKRGAFKFSCKTAKITEAKRFAELEVIRRQRPEFEKQVARKQKGILNPLLLTLWEEEFIDIEVRPEVGPRTLMTYEQNWKFGMEGFWGDKTTADLTDDNMFHYRNWYLETNPTRVCDHTIAHFKRFVKCLRRKKLIKEMPDFSAFRKMSKAISGNAQRFKVGRVYEEQEIADMLAATGDESFSSLAGLRTRVGILLGAEAGMRKAEVLDARFSRVSSSGLHVWSFKNKRWRTVPLTPRAIATIVALRSLQMDMSIKTDLLFPMHGDHKRSMSSQLLDKDWKEVKRLAGITQWNVRNRARFHDLRHTCATKMGEDGWPPKVACDMLDMSLREFDQTYSKPRGGKTEEWVRRTFDKSSSGVQAGEADA